jgi:hypothetical protein
MGHSEDTREDFPRVSVDTFPDWRRIEGNYRRAALEELEAQIAENGLESERDAMVVHLNKVGRHSERSNV